MKLKILDESDRDFFVLKRVLNKDFLNIIKNQSHYRKRQF